MFNPIMQDILNVAKNILSNEIDIVTGSRTISILRHNYKFVDETIFNFFVHIDSEYDHLPFDDVEKLCSKKLLEKKKCEIKKAQKMYKSDVDDACRNLIEYLNKIEK